MDETHGPIPVQKDGLAKRLAYLATAALMFGGCLLGNAEKAAPADRGTDPTNALSEKDPERPGIPSGCSMEWSPAKGDSVVNCPDIRPPSPR